MLGCFEEDPYLPSVFVDCRNSAGTGVEMVGEFYNLAVMLQPDPKQLHAAGNIDISLVHGGSSEAYNFVWENKTMECGAALSLLRVTKKILVIVHKENRE